MATRRIDPADCPRPRWVEVGRGDFAILITVVGSAALIRWAEDRGGYAWRSVTQLTRRPDLDIRPAPAWLAKARASRRPPPALWWLCGLVPAPPDTLDADTLDVTTEPNSGLLYRCERCARTWSAAAVVAGVPTCSSVQCVPDARPAPDFDTDADGRPLS